MKKYLLMILSLLLCCSILSGCGGSEGNSSMTEQNNEVILANFESKKELLSMNFRDTVAKVELSDKKETVTSGTYSAKMTFHGVYDYTNEFYQDAKFYIIPGNDFCTKTGYLDVEELAVDVFNENDKDLKFAISLGNPLADFNMYQFDTVTLKPGMNHIRYDFNRERISCCIDLQKVEFFTFLIQGREKEEEPFVLYFDNFRAITTEDGFEKSTKDPKDKILTDFSEEADFVYYGYFGSVSSLLTKPTFTKNTDLNYILTGNASLKIEFYENRQGTGADSVGFRTKDREFNWNDFDGDKTYLSYDMFNATDHELTVSMTVYSKLNETISVNCVIPAQSWASGGNTILLSEMNDAFKGDALDIYTITFQLIGLQAGDVVYLDNLVLKEN